MCIDIPKKLLDEDVAVDLVRECFADGPDGRARYSGAYFERLGGGGDRPEVANQVTADDLLAVSVLGVPVVGYYALHVLEYRSREIGSLLARVPVDVKLTDDGAGDLIARNGPAWELRQLLHGIKPRLRRSRLGPVAAGKLLARKRPHLIPVYDSHVKKVLGRPRNDQTWWSDLHCQLARDDALVRELETVRAGRAQGAFPCCGPSTSCAGCPTLPGRPVPGGRGRRATGRERDWPGSDGCCGVRRDRGLRS
jgi:hypothetical protein